MPVSAPVSGLAISAAGRARPEGPCRRPRRDAGRTGRDRLRRPDRRERRAPGRVHKTTIYRRWKDRESLVTAEPIDTTTADNAAKVALAAARAGALASGAQRT
jgi:hypothetical protein